jgi:hypothetical protein
MRLTEGSMGLDFHTPKRSPPGPDAFDVSPKRVKAWVEALPIANSGETARLLFVALREVNTLAVRPADRFRFLESLRGPVEHLSAALERHYIGKPFPLSARDQKVAELGRTFQSLMATGYQILLEDLATLPGLVLVRKRRLLAVAVHRAVRYLSRTLLKSYQLYAPYPDNVWRDIHQVYRFAVRARLQHRKVMDDQNSLVRRTSITQTYKQILLLAISSPYRLRQGDVVKLYNALERWASYCRLNPIDTRAQNWQGLFGVPADIDDQPKYLDLRQKGQTGRLEWVLDTADLGGVLRDQLEYLTNPEAVAPAPAAAPPPDISPQLLRRVMQSWGMMVRREYARLENSGDYQVEVALGLSAIHHFLRVEEPKQEAAETDDEETELSADSHTPFPWAAIALHKVRHESVLCRVGDEGAGGYRLLWPGASPAKAQVGALLAIRRGGAAEDATWPIGVVRWMRAAEETSLEVGVQMLAPSAEAIWVRVCNVHGQCGERLASLLLPAVEAPPRPEIIIGPVFLHNFNTALLARGGRESMVRFTRVLENTGSFAQFEFEPADVQDETAEVTRRAEDEEPEAEGEFDSLWSSF